MKKGWKIFDKNLCCRGYQYEIGKTYTHKGEIELCASGFHFHENSTDLFKYYAFSTENRVCEISAHKHNKQKIITGDDKSVCSKIKIIRELPWNEVLKIINTGKDNSGNWNSGDRNSGDRNSGDRNSGNRNSGNRNSGHWNSGNRNSGNRNSGHWNSGDRNSGHWNSGHWNSGDGNSGDRNSGHWNSGDWSSGVFCTERNPRVKIFDKESNITMREWNDSEWADILSNFRLTEWVCDDNMTDQEKVDNPEFFVAGGYLKTRKYKEAFKILWDGLTKNERKKIKTIPNFDNKKFEEITGVSMPPLTRKILQKKMKDKAEKGQKFISKKKKSLAILGLKAMLREGKITESEYSQMIKILENKEG